VTNPYSQPQENATETGGAVRRLNWGSGEHPHPGWINSDIKDGPGIDISCDIREGLPLDDASIEYIASIHALPEIPMPDLVGALRELRRVLEPGGVLRLGLPDLDKGIKAYMENDRNYFLIPDEDAATIGGKFVTQLLWYGWSRTLFTHDFTEELLREAGFSTITACSYRETKSRFPEIVELDSRERESFFVEAVK
jgi:SAM-dependent methyltransferase